MKSSGSSKIKSLKSLPTLATDLWNMSPALCSVMLLLRIVGAGLPVLALGVGGMLLDAVNRGMQTHLMGTAIWNLVILEASIMLLLNLISGIAAHVDLLLTSKFSLEINLKLIAHCTRLDLETFENGAFQDRLQRARTQLSSQVALLKTLIQSMQQIVGLVGIGVSALFVAPALIGLQFLAVLPVVFAESRFARIRYKVTRERTPIKRYLEYLVHIVTSTAAAKEVKLFDTSGYVYEEFRGRAEEHDREDLQLSVRSSRAGIWLSAMGTAIFYGTYVLLIGRALHGYLTIGRLVFVAALLQRFRAQLAAFLGNITQGIDQLLYISDVVEFFSDEAKLTAPKNPVPLPGLIQMGLEFRNVSFSYEGASAPVLTNISFSIRPGEVVALVGENGAGKSTIAKLLTRLYDPSSGDILLDGINLRDFSPASLRGCISAVFQDYVKYDLSVSLNIAMGQIGARKDIQSVRDAAKQANIEEFIERLPTGFEQVLGRRFAGGIDLSGGQWQRLALARAFMRRAQIIILDEPTSAVDPRAEAALYEDVRRLSKGKITLLISHRLSNVRRADKIIVLKNGRVCEQGSHDHLIRLEGEYESLFRLQAAAYID